MSFFYTNPLSCRDASSNTRAHRAAIPTGRILHCEVRHSCFCKPIASFEILFIKIQQWISPFADSALSSRNVHLVCYTNVAEVEQTHLDFPTCGAPYMSLCELSQIYYLRRGIGPSLKLLLATVIKSKKWQSHFFLNSTFSLNRVKFLFFFSL